MPSDRDHAVRHTKVERSAKSDATDGAAQKAPAKLPPKRKVRKASEKQRSKLGSKALREIRHQQLSTKNVIPKVPFRKLAMDILKDINAERRGSRAG